MARSMVKAMALATAPAMAVVDVRPARPAHTPQPRSSDWLHRFLRADGAGTVAAGAGAGFLGGMLVGEAIGDAGHHGGYGGGGYYDGGGGGDFGGGGGDAGFAADS